MSRAAFALLAGAGVAVGVLAEQQAYAWTELRNWLPDLVAGWILIGLGLALLALRRPRGAVLLVVAGFSWFAFNFATTGPAALEWVAARSAFLHRGALLALALALLAGRPRTRLAVAGVALAWAAAVAWPLWDNEYSALVLVSIFVALAAAGYRRSRGRRGQAIAGRVFAAVVILGAAVAAGALARVIGGSQSVIDATVFAYAVAVAVSGVVLSTAALQTAPAALVDRAIALERGGMRLRDVLRELLGDPSLEIGFADGGGQAFDDAGRPLPLSGPGMTATQVVVAGRQAGVVNHDPRSLVDEPTRSAVLAAAGLAAERARLRAEIDRRVETVEASRRRLLLAEEEERRRLAETLDRSTGAALADLGRLVHEARPGAGAALAAALDRAAGQLVRARPELDALVRGLGGVDSAGLVRGLEQLAEAVPIPVELDLAEVALSREAASAIWFVCAESLANVVKHAQADRARVALWEEGGVVRLSVEDDGRGGADAGGSGLVGLADRVAALGGRFALDSPPGAGTRVVAELPLVEDLP